MNAHPELLLDFLQLLRDSRHLLLDHAGLSGVLNGLISPVDLYWQQANVGVCATNEASGERMT